MFFTTRHKVATRALSCLAAALLSIHHVHAAGREGDSLRAIAPLSLPSPRALPARQLVIPGVLMLHGVIETTLASRARMLNYAIGHQVMKHPPEKFQVDDISQYLPAASVYALDLLGVKARDGFKERTIVLGMSVLFTAASVNALKYATRVKRPDGSTRNSFPSGHTAVAFMGAEFLWQEYRHVSIWYGIAGYAVAAGTGFFRMYNNRHWFGDVVFGAGLGMLSTKLAYRLYPPVRRAFTGKRRGGAAATFCPYYDGRRGGISLFIQL